VSLLEVLPNIHALPRAEKIRLIQLLAQDLAEAEADPRLEAGRDYPVWSPDRAFAAAETLHETLRAE
jgi:hypothetical protein